LTFAPDVPRRVKTPPPKPKPPRRRGVALGVAGAVLVLVLGFGVLAAVVINGYLAGTPPIPSQEALWTLRRSPGMTFLDRNGQVIATRGAKYGFPVRLVGLPSYVPRAFLAAEDRRFYQHGPVDLHAIARAVEANFRAHRSVQGASTLTQQLARGLFLKREQSLKRKVQEAYLAWRLEQAMSKDEILELYLNRTYFGAGAYGLDAAARTYFGKPAAQLTLAEAATLAGLPNAPTRLALTNNMPGALARAHRILDIMRAEGWIDAAAEQTALSRPPVLAPAPAGEGDMSYVLDQAAEQAAQLTGGATPDLVVATTIAPELQAAGVDAVRQVVTKEGAHRAVSQGALVSLAPDGAILAMVGGLDHGASSFNRVVQARRQPGSAFKPFVFGTAVEQGLTPEDVRQDAPISLGGWEPENYGHSYAGAVTLREALARSLNTVSVRLTLQFGPDAVAAFARRLGLSDIPLHPGPSIALGAYEVSPLELAGGYQVFQSGGGRTTPYLIREIRSTRGEVLYAHAASAPTPVLNPLYATRMVDMLKAVITSGTGVAANIGRPAAGKTGTSQNWRDAWFVGFTPDILTAVWVGNDDGRPMAKVTGGELPALIWHRFMLVAEGQTPPADFPWLTAEPPPSQEPAQVTTAGYSDDPTLEGGGTDQPTADSPPPPDDQDRSDRPDDRYAAQPYDQRDTPQETGPPYPGPSYDGPGYAGPPDGGAPERYGDERQAPADDPSQPPPDSADDRRRTRY
jgi:penicillin-binding protein 1A